MKEKIMIYMVVRNICQKKELVAKVMSQASKVSKDFFIVDHGSNDKTQEVLKKISRKKKLNMNIQSEVFEGTMDDMKGKYYKVLKEKYGKVGKYILILDWDEILDDELVKNISALDFSYDIYYINRNTYLITKPIDKNSYLPLLFEINSLEIAPFEKFHKLYNALSSKTKKLYGVLHHYSYSSIEDLFSKNKFYAKGEAEDLFLRNPNVNSLVVFLKCVFEGTLYFAYTLIYHFNFLHLEGWFYSLNWYVYKFYKYLFYIELKYEKEKKYFGNL